VFTGLCAFPLTPVSETTVDETAFAGLVRRVAEAGVDSIGALGSTGSYAYLTRDERRAVAEIAVEAAGDVPVIVGVGALRTRDVLGLVDDAQSAGAAGLLLAPVSYQPLTDEEVYGLYRDVTSAASVPVVVYDNPGTTRVHFSDQLHARIAGLPGVVAVKIPPTPLERRGAAARIGALRAVLPEGHGIGISGDASAAVALAAGCDTWFSVVGGVLPEPALGIVRAAARGDHEHARAVSERLSPLWSLFGRHGSVRVAAGIAEHLGLIGRPNLPRPLLALPEEGYRAVGAVLRALGLGS
jgi:4-hydroxy-tetrahydrodipicolinate synthase